MSTAALKKLLPNFLLMAGAFVRLIGTGTSALWYDESVTLYRVQLPLMQMLQNGSEQAGDLLLELILRPLIAVSQSVWMLRLPSILATIGTFLLVAVLMERMGWTWQARTISAFLISFLPGLIWMGQDGRAYALFTLLLVAAVLFAWEGRWLGMTACLGLLCFTHNTAPAYVLPVLIFFWVVRPKKVKHLLLAGLITGLVYLPQFYFVVANRFTDLGLAPLHTLTPTLALFQLKLGLWVGTLPRSLSMLYYLTLVGTVVLVIRKRTLSWLLFQLAILPMLVMLLVSLYSNVFVYRTIAPALFMLMLWLGFALGELPITWPRFAMLCYWAALVTIGARHFDPAARGAGLDRVADQIRSEWKDGDVLAYGTQTVGLPFNYYLSDLPHVYLRASACPFLDPPGVPLLSSSATLEDASRIWLIFPQDALLAPGELASLESMTNGQEPIYHLDFIQMSVPEVYLLGGHQ